MDYLSELENESIYIIREAYNKIKNPAMLWSIGKDSTVMLWLVKKAFLGHCPFPVIHIDTTYKIPEMIKFRDEKAVEWNLRLIIGKNEQAIKNGMSPEKGRLECCGELKTEGLRQIIEANKFKGLFLGIRRDEEGSRAKERFFSPRDKNFEWDYKDQPPELWDQFKTDFNDDQHIRIHPILHWTELNVWEYVKRENIPIIDLYFAVGGYRYRSLGCVQCTGKFKSDASTIDEIIRELKETKESERSGRAQDKVNPYAMQKLRAKGYM